MSHEGPFRILALSGSYRTGSFNQALIAAARDTAPAHVRIVDFDLRTVPHYDCEVEVADPAPVEDLKRAVREAHAILVVTPEYNSGVPGVLKNGIDWASRFYPNAPIGGKLVALMGATPGRSGTRYAQAQLRQVLSRTGAVVLEEPELLVARAGQAIEDGVVTSAEVRAQVAAVVEALLHSAQLVTETGSSAAVA